ncbi:hypothetical protein EZV62_002664 [Acer yangbiense]|uniref:Factor of DNA methylation 1-5/IDN2 domain-containing protein n=1 Tax=Acer yangbiense TaxID=1000413 RepID=A0A5C7IXU4_9ROSI|nr:hypothetical protein EZV62_002664 [Acer yangbiense]
MSLLGIEVFQKKSKEREKQLQLQETQFEAERKRFIKQQRMEENQMMENNDMKEDIRKMRRNTYDDIKKIFSENDQVKLQLVQKEKELKKREKKLKLQEARIEAERIELRTQKRMEVLPNLEDETLKFLKNEYGEEVCNAVTEALLEMKEYPRGPELWNHRGNKRATRKEVVKYLLNLRKGHENFPNSENGSERKKEKEVIKVPEGVEAASLD